jgi:hypothetical protein
MVIIDFVGAFEITVALFKRGVATPGFHENVLPFLMVATNICPKLSKDQSPGLKDVIAFVVDEPQPVPPV